MLCGGGGTHFPKGAYLEQVTCVEMACMLFNLGGGEVVWRTYNAPVMSHAIPSKVYHSLKMVLTWLNTEIRFLTWKRLDFTSVEHMKDGL